MVLKMGIKLYFKLFLKLVGKLYWWIINFLT